MNIRDELECAIHFATEAHAGQRDKQGQPVILHVLRVMLATPTGDAQTVAALHDVVEDTGTTLDDLLESGFSRAVVAGVDAITRRDTETYREYIRRLSSNPLARAAKIADLRDNLARGAAFPSLCSRYRTALQVLGAA